MNTSRVISTSIVVWIVGALFTWLTCGWLFNWVYTLPPMIWLSPDVMSSAANLFASNVITLITSFLFVIVFVIIQRGIPGKGINQGLSYGFFIWLVGALPGLATMPFYMTIATTVVFYWLGQSLVLSLISGALTAAIYKAK